MSEYKLLLPKMGESVAEATMIKWVKQVGDFIELDEVVVEIATDKVDSEIPSPVSGKLLQIIKKENEIAQVNECIAIIETEKTFDFSNNQQDIARKQAEHLVVNETIIQHGEPYVKQGTDRQQSKISTATEEQRFYSPLVKNIAKQEGISNEELENIFGSGAGGRLTKEDVFEFLKTRNANSSKSVEKMPKTALSPEHSAINDVESDEIMEMDRMRRLIADHMVMSKQVSPHVTSFVEADVTNLVRWREKNKKPFEDREKEKITFTPIFVECVTKALKDFPMINISVQNHQILKKKDINIGIAAALPTGNLIVPVIKKADQLNLIGLSKKVNDLANRARKNKLSPDETQGGTFTITNIGTFGNIMGTPIINQPQVAILAIGSIEKKPAVLETEFGDTIAIRHKMYLSLSYDHRVVDGALGGSFLRRIADYMEAWDVNRNI